MIAKVVHGWRIGGLVAYLMGPGRAQEHVDPRVIASWDGRDAGWQPAAGPGGGLDLGPLTVALRAPAIAAELPERPVDGRRGYVWHCSARVSAADRVLSDAEWAGAARELLDGAGIVRAGDPGGARWVAIRHADDHIHIAVVLVRQDTCRRFWPPLRDYVGLRQAAQRIEQRLGLTVTAAADGTAAPVPTRGEREKAARLGQEPARLQLARAVRSAAVASDGVEGFVAELERADLVVGRAARAVGGRDRLHRRPAGRRHRRRAAGRLQRQQACAGPVAAEAGAAVARGRPARDVDGRDDGRAPPGPERAGRRSSGPAGRGGGGAGVDRACGRRCADRDAVLVARARCRGRPLRSGSSPTGRGRSDGRSDVGTSAAGRAAAAPAAARDPVLGRSGGGRCRPGGGDGGAAAGDRGVAAPTRS